MAHYFPIKRVLENKVRRVSIHHQDVASGSDCGIARHELSGGDGESCLPRGWETADHRSIGLEECDATLLGLGGPAFRAKVPPTIDVDEVFGAVLDEEVGAVSAHEAFAEASDEGTVFLKDEKRVFWVVRHEVEEAVPSLNHRMAVDDGGGNRIGLAPGRVDPVTGGTVSENGALIGKGLGGGFCGVVMGDGRGDEQERADDR